MKVMAAVTSPLRAICWPFASHFGALKGNASSRLIGLVGMNEVADATVRYWSSRRMDNDQANTQLLIPANATVDFKLSGTYDRYFWSLSVNNVFNALYYDYAVASAFTEGRFSAYPLPGRSYMVKTGATF